MKSNYIYTAALLLKSEFTLATQLPLGEATAHENGDSRTDQLKSIIDASPLLSFHREIVQIPSISGHEKSVGDFVFDFIQSYDLTVEKQIVIPKTESNEERFNIFAYTGINRFPDVILTSHIDTVPPFVPYSLHSSVSDKTIGATFNRSDLVLAGRGTVDAKASVATMLFAAFETLTEFPNASIGLLFDVGEENSGIGMKYFSNSDLNPSPSKFHTVIFGEPTELNLVAGHKGTLGLKVIAHGKAAHSGYPWLGTSAISSLLPVLSHLDTLQETPPQEGGLLRSEKFGKSTLNIGFIRAGLASNVVPAYAEAAITIRLAAGDPEDTKGIIKKAVEDLAGDKNISLDFGDPDSGSPPQQLDIDVDGFDVITVNYGTDIPSLQIHNEGPVKVKRYLYGPGSIHVAHGEEEAITVGKLEDAVEGYKKLISAALGGY